MEIAKNIKYVGVSDKNLDLFEGQYKVPNGMSYHSYLILDEKIAVLDTVDARFKDERLNKIDAELSGKEQREELTVRCHDAVCRLAGIDPKENLYPPIYDDSKRVDYYATEYGIGYKGSW